MAIRKQKKRIRDQKGRVGKTDTVVNQSIRFVVRRDIWKEFQANCERSRQKPLANLRDWIAQFNEHCEAGHENTTD